jgi:hypothetical protein
VLTTNVATFSDCFFFTLNPTAQNLLSHKTYCPARLPHSRWLKLLSGGGYLRVSEKHMTAVCFDLATAKQQKAVMLQPGRLAFFVKLLKILWKAVSLFWNVHATGWNVI